MADQESSNVEAVTAFLRGQNLEQLGRIDEAVSLYEGIVASGFDASGPYDRLIAIYSDGDDHASVERIATLAVSNVRTHPQKTQWYEQMKAGAQAAVRNVPPAVPKRP